MTRWQLYLLLGLAFVLGVVAVQFTPGFPDAVAQEETAPLPDEPDEAPAPQPEVEPEPVIDASGGRLVCRLFLVDVTDSASLDTADRTTEVGQWVGEQVDGGMMLHGVDFEVGQKSTGYPQGYAHVCVYPG